MNLSLLVYEMSQLDNVLFSALFWHQDYRMIVMHTWKFPQTVGANKVLPT